MTIDTHSATFGPWDKAFTLRVAATRQGVTCEAFGEWNGLARRYERLGKRVEARECLERALWVHEAFGVHDAKYAAGPDTLADVRRRLAALAN